MQNQKKIELTAEEQREADEYDALMAPMLTAAQVFNEANGTSGDFEIPGAITLGKMEAAASSGKLWMVKRALNEGADPNEASEVFGTPLHAAAGDGSLEIVQLLIEKGADPRQVDTDGLTPAEVAANWGYTAVAAYLESLPS